MLLSVYNSPQDVWSPTSVIFTHYLVPGVLVSVHTNSPVALDNTVLKLVWLSKINILKQQWTFESTLVGCGKWTHYHSLRYHISTNVGASLKHCILQYFYLVKYSLKVKLALQFCIFACMSTTEITLSYHIIICCLNFPKYYSLHLVVCKFTAVLMMKKDIESRTLGP